MTSVYEAVAKANARLRAWVALGVPFVGGWVVHAPPAEGAPPYVDLGLRCAHCTDRVFSRLWGSGGPVPWQGAYASDEYLARRERGDVDELLCKHVGAFLGPEPPEFAGLFALELLAGGAP